MKFYGCLQNRLEEGRNFTKEIKVGTGVTEYYYSDRKPFEVIEVIDQKHIVIRAMDSKRIDNNGMSDSQSYEFISNPKNITYKLVLKNNVWYKEYEINKETWLKRAKEDTAKGYFKTEEGAYRYFRAMSGLTDKQYEKVDAGKSVKKYVKMNVSIGIMDKYYDYTF
jgi:hypothetical protein